MMKKIKIILPIIILAVILAGISIRTGLKNNQPSSGEKEVYYDTVELALQNSETNEEAKKTITKAIHKFENDKYLTIYYLAQEDKNSGYLILAKFQKKSDNGNEQYKLQCMKPVWVHKDAVHPLDGLELVKSNMEMLNMYQAVNIDPGSSLFMCGDNGDKSIYKLKIDGQSPDGIEEYELFGEKRYFWYYENLKSKKPVSDMIIEFTE